jgi:hypothetical protein
LLSLVTVVGCQDSMTPGLKPGVTPGDVSVPDSTDSGDEPAEHLVAGPERDVQLIAEKAVLGFRAADATDDTDDFVVDGGEGFAASGSEAFVIDGGELRAGYATHDVRVQRGIIELTPYHHPAGGARVTGGKLGIQTGVIAREDGTVLVASGAQAANAAGAVEITRGEAVEVLTNREDGIQQEWRFAATPAGEGDLNVEVLVSGQRFVSETPSGLHFQSAAGLGFRYSHALWLDAAGNEWPIQAVWKEDRIAITVPADILAQTVFPAVLDPTISAEVAVDTQVNGATGANSTFPSVAFDGTNYLVVWSDQRLSRDEDIFATRVSPAGAILSTTGITVNAGPGRQLHPVVVFAGNQFVVAWEDFKIANGVEANIGAARISTAGVVTQLGNVAPSAQNETDPKLAANGNTALLVWNNAGDIRASLFNGAAFGGAISITADAAIQSTPAVASNPGGNYLVAYTEGAAATADLKGQFVTAAGVKAGAALTLSAGAGRQSDPAAAWDGTRYVVTFTNNNLGINLFGTRVSTAGVVLDTRNEGITPNVGGVSISSAPGNQELSNLVCKVGSCFVVWQDSGNAAASSFDVHAQRLDVATALAPSGPEIIVSNANRGQFVPAVATNNTDFLTVWQDARDTDTNTVFGARVTAAGSVADANGLMLVTGNNRESAPAMGRAGGTFGVFWTDSRNYGSDIELTRFSGATKLDPTARAVSSAPFAQAGPAVTMSAGNFVAVWNDSRNGQDRDIFAARITAAGAVLDPNGTPVAVATGDQLVPEISTNGTISLVVWEDRRAGNFDIFGAILDNATGTVTASDIVICNVAGDQTRPAVAFDTVSGQFLVVWTDSRVAVDPNVFGARVTTAGAVLDANGVVISAAGNGQFTPRATFLGGTGLVVWEDRRIDTQGDVFGGRVTLGGSLAVLDADGFSISGNAAGEQLSPTASSLSGSFLVAWTDGRNINTTGTDIFGQQIGTSGAINGPAFAISADPGNEDDPVLSDALTNVTRIAYTRLRPDLQTVRVATRTIGASSGTGQSCSNNGQCSTGFCVDSRCCDVACGGNDKTDCQACARSITGGVDGTCSFIPATSFCRNYANTKCDLREYCTGASPECPPDVGRNQGQVCNSTTGAVCPANAPPGPHGCP